MAKFVEVEEAIGMSGLRVVLSLGVPGPWSEAAKGILHVKKLPYVRVRQEILGANPALLRWSAQTTAPVVAWNDERPRSIWIDQLYLFERLAPEPPLLPERLAERVEMIGLANEVFGEDGFVWNRRHLMVREFTTADRAEKVRKLFVSLGEKYDYTPEMAARAPRRCAEILRALAARLEAQRARGSRYFFGDRLTALDVYWACSATLLLPLPHDVCAMPGLFREVYTNRDPQIAEAAAPILLEHRDFVYREHLELPIDL